MSKQNKKEEKKKNTKLNQKPSDANESWVDMLHPAADFSFAIPMLNS